MLCEQAGFDRQVSGLTRIVRIAIHNVNVTARDRISGKAVMIVPNGIAYETGANPAVLDAKFLHCRKQRHDMRLSLWRRYAPLVASCRSKCPTSPMRIENSTHRPARMQSRAVAPCASSRDCATARPGRGRRATDPEVALIPGLPIQRAWLAALLARLQGGAEQ